MPIFKGKKPIEKIGFNPKIDITTFELSQCMKLLNLIFHPHSLASSWTGKEVWIYALELYTPLPWEVKRHFVFYTD